MPKVRVSSLLATHECVEAFWDIFSCQHCGRCCTEFRGMKLTEEEVRRLDVPEKDWPATFKMAEGKYILEQPCPYYNSEQHRCLVYSSRPDVCRNFPVNTVLSADGHRHMGVMTKCSAAVEALEVMESISGVTENGSG